MIVMSQRSRLRLITQPDHARFAAQLLALWRRDGLPEYPRRRELLFAVREHDNGWREVDAAPPTDPRTGQPCGFAELPDTLRRELWDRGIERYSGERPYAALLILEHARVLHARHAASPGWRGWLERLRERRDELAGGLAVDPAELHRDYEWLALADRLSLTVCAGDPAPVAIPGGTARATADGPLVLDPFPLAGATTFEIPVRFLPDRRYSGDGELGGELAEARWQRLRIGVRPL